MVIKVNDYVRYKYEDCIYIGKIKFISEVMGFDKTLQFKIDNCMEEILKQDISKTSPRIIDLIEVGDYVNGMLVRHIAYLDGKEKNLMFTDNCEVSSVTNDYVTNKNIKSVLTKEMFEQMEYKIN